MPSFIFFLTIKRNACVHCGKIGKKWAKRYEQARYLFCLTGQDTQPQQWVKKCCLKPHPSGQH